MKIIIQKAVYSGVDGTNISPDRCEKYLLMLDMLDEMGDTLITYKELQEEATSRNLFSGTKNIASAIRTIVPILGKFGFLCEYSGEFKANDFFTPLGRMFLYTIDAINKLDILNPKHIQIKACLESAKQHILQLGLLQRATIEPNSQIWIVFYLLTQLKTITKDTYLYALSYIQDGKQLSSMINALKANPNLENNTYLKEDLNLMDSTSYTYLFGLLEDAGLVIKVNSSEYQPSSDFKDFILEIKPLIAKNTSKEFITLLK